MPFSGQVQSAIQKLETCNEVIVGALQGKSARRQLQTDGNGKDDRLKDPGRGERRGGGMEERGGNNSEDTRERERER